VIVEYSYAAMNLSNAVSEAALNDGYGMWIAARLSDGKSDGNIYPTKGIAMQFAIKELRLLHETQAVYLKVPLDGSMPPSEAERYLAIHRKLYDGGLRLTDPDKEVIIPMNKEDINLFLKGK
jgi:hypothetical protein